MSSFVHMSVSFGSMPQPIRSPPPLSRLAVSLKTAAGSPSVKLNLPSAERQGELSREQGGQAGFILDVIHFERRRSPKIMENSLAGARFLALQESGQG